MRAIEDQLNGLVLLEPTVFEDDRGSLYESYSKRTFTELTGFDGEFVQDNHSTSIKGVLRGIHYQLPKPQGKLIRCVEGAIWDVAVDLRRSSPTFGQWKGYELTESNRHQLWIPIGFGHAFVVLSDRAQVLYRTTEIWDPECDRSVIWNDPDIAIVWPIQGEPVLSPRDAGAVLLSEVPLFD